MADQPEPKGLTAATPLNEAQLDELTRVAASDHLRCQLGELTTLRLIHQARLSLTLQRRAEEAGAKLAAIEKAAVPFKRAYDRHKYSDGLSLHNWRELMLALEKP